MESGAQGWVGVDEAVVEEGVNAEDDLVEAAISEAPQRVCQVRGHVGDEGTWQSCQHRACLEQDQYKLFAMSERLAEEASKTVARGWAVKREKYWCSLRLTE